MSIIKKPYTISVWDDVWNGEKFVEKRVCIIGSDKMESQCRAIEPNLTRNTNGTKKLTFKLYKRYKDNITGELVENPFYDWLVNERKVKLKYDGKWYDFVIKNIQENSSNYLYTYQLEDALAQELSKNGFNVELNDELMNNSGTAKELADKVLEETDWDVESEPFIERIEESLVWLTVRSGHSLKAQKIVDKGMTTGEVELGAGTDILAFYSSCANTPYRFQFIYVDGGLSKITKDDNRLITNSDCQYYIDNPIYYEPKENDSDYNDYATARAYGFVLPVDLNTTTVEETENSTGVTLSGEYRAKRYGFTQKSVFSPVLNRYVNIYKRIDSNGKVVDEEYYGYLNTEYKSPVLTQNILSNTEFTSTTGWIGTKEQGGKLATTENVVFRLNEKGERTDIKLIDDLSTTDINKHQYASYMKLTFENNTSIVINSGPYDNRISIGNMEVGEEYALICTDDKNKKPNLNFDLGEYTYQTGNGGYYVKDNSKIVFKKKDTDLPAGITAIFTVKSNTYSKKTFKKRSQVRLAITGAGTTYISNISLFKVVRDDNGNIILPENQAEDINDRVIDTTYYFFKKDTLTSATNEEEVKPDATLKALDYSQFIPVINEDAQKIRTISAKESNYFNILQSIAETFEAWLDFEITRDPETGAITDKKVKFRNYIGKENPVGFKYGINLKDIQRTFESKQIVTKLIVKDNSNEFADNGFCSIARAGANPTGENYIYDFQYFFNRGLLSARDYLDTLYAYNIIDPNNSSNKIYAQGKDINENDTEYNIVGYFPRIKALNRKIDERNEILINLSKDITTLKAKYEVAQTGAEAASSNMEGAAADYVKTTGEEITATLPAGWKDRTDVQKILQSYATYKIEHDKYVAEESTLEGELKSVQEQYNILANEIDGYKKHKIALNQLFFSRYSRFIQEGTWIDESYVDDEKYYADAQSTLYNSCYPKAAYTVNVIEISKLPGYEDFTYDLGDKTFIEDKEFFGSAARVEVVLTETTENLDDPTKNKLKIQTFKNQFQDLFQKITATVQQTQYSTGSYEKAVALAEANQERKNQFVTDALDGADARLQVAGQQSVEIGDDGITITDVDTPSDKIRMVGGAILLSKQDKNGETKWVTGVTSDGISASLITAGTLNAGEISIMNYDEPVFRWDSFGLSAYDNNRYTDENGNPVVSGVNPKKFVRFDKYGIYGINGGVDGANWYPGLNTKDTPQEDIDKKATFALTWEGLKVTGNGATVFIGKHGTNNNVLFSVNKDNVNTFVVKNDGTTLIGGENGWRITSTGLMLNQNGNVYLGNPAALGNKSNIVFKAGSHFLVNQEGKLYATDGEFTGKITAEIGFIGGVDGWEITTGAIRQGGDNNTIYLGSKKDFTINGIYKKDIIFKAGNNFSLDVNGNVTITGGKISWSTIQDGPEGGMTEAEKKDFDNLVSSLKITELKEDSIISPNIGGGRLSIYKGNKGITIDPEEDDIFTVKDAGGNVVIGFDEDGNAIFNGVITAKEGGRIGGFTINADSLTTQGGNNNSYYNMTLSSTGLSFLDKANAQGQDFPVITIYSTSNSNLFRIGTSGSVQIGPSSDYHTNIYAGGIYLRSSTTDKVVLNGTTGGITASSIYLDGDTPIKIADTTKTNTYMEINATKIYMQSVNSIDTATLSTDGLNVSGPIYASGQGQYQLGTTYAGQETYYIPSISFNSESGGSGSLKGQWSIQELRQGSSSAITSDLTKKHTINRLSQVYSLLFDKLQPISYKYNDSRSDRTHTGFIAQHVEQAVIDCGLTTKDFAAVCYDLDEEGNKVDYTIRYEELIALCVNEIQKLKARIAELESK